MTTTAYEAIITKPVQMVSLRFPKLHAIIYDQVPILVRLEDGAEIPTEVNAMALLDSMTYVGLIPSARIVIGLPAGAAV